MTTKWFMSPYSWVIYSSTQPQVANQQRYKFYKFLCLGSTRGPARACLIRLDRQISNKTLIRLYLMTMHIFSGNPRLGYILHDGKYFSISSVERAEQFGTNPKLFLSAIQKLTRENPCLLKLLSLRDCDEEMIPRPVTADRSSQTATHPVEKVKLNFSKTLLVVSTI